MGLAGIMTWGFIVLAYWHNLRRMKRLQRRYPEHAHELPFRVAGAVGTGILLLLFLGNFGHNLFRFTWLWYGGFLIIARATVERAVPIWEWERLQSESEEFITEPTWEPEAGSGWVRHESHVMSSE
jgi:hypothetical protein